MARVHPIDFSDVWNVDVESGAGRGQAGTPRTMLKSGISGLERAFSALSWTDNALSVSRSSSALSALSSSLSRAGGISFASLEGSKLDDDAAVQFSEDEDTEEPAAAVVPPSAPQPTTPHGKRVSSVRTQLWRIKLRARSKWKRRMRSRALFGPVSLSKARIWLAAYVSLADTVSDIYSISVRPK
jgi:hypothetical protein